MSPADPGSAGVWAVPSDRPPQDSNSPSWKVVRIKIIELAPDMFSREMQSPGIFLKAWWRATKIKHRKTIKKLSLACQRKPCSRPRAATTNLQPQKEGWVPGSIYVLTALNGANPSNFLLLSGSSSRSFASAQVLWLLCEAVREAGSICKRVESVYYSDVVLFRGVGSWNKIRSLLLYFISLGIYTEKSHRFLRCSVARESRTCMCVSHTCVKMKCSSMILLLFVFFGQCIVCSWQMQSKQK